MAQEFRKIDAESKQEDTSDLEDFFEMVLTFQCKSCSFVSKDKASLRSHLKEFHTQTKNPVEAKHLESNAVTKTEPATESTPPRTSSMEVDQEKEVFLCAECNIVFPSEEACCTHMIHDHGLKDFDANLIRDDPSKKAPVERQRRNVRLPRSLTLEGGAIMPKKYRVTKDMPLKCSMCPIRFESTETIQLHEQCHIRRPALPESKERNKNNGFNCLICIASKGSQNFTRWSKCAMHLWKTHQIDCDLYGCSQLTASGKCQFKTHLVTKLKEHESIHAQITAFKCNTCHKSFKQQKQLKTHEKYHKEKMTKLPPEGDARWYTPKECTICKRILSDSKCLKKHISAVHNNLKPYVCNICGHTSARKAELQLHIRQHTGEKPYKCSTCDFATGDHNSLRKHVLRHTEIRPYSCHFCNYRCIQSSAYKKHVLNVHPDKEAIFVCPFCPLIWVRENLFQAHVKDHEEGRIPPQDTHNDSSSSPVPLARLHPGAENESAQTLPCPTETQAKRKPSEVQYWMREDDSVEMEDTGGITIPAPEPTEPSESSTSKTSENETELEIVEILELELPKNQSSQVTPSESSELRLKLEPKALKTIPKLSKAVTSSCTIRAEVEDEFTTDKQTNNSRFGSVSTQKSWRSSSCEEKVSQENL